MQKETLVSIANRIGCSVSTVSRVINGNAEKYRISKKTSAKILAEVKKNNFIPNILAKGLRTNKTDTIGLIIPNIENSFFANLSSVIIKEARNYNYKIVISDTQENEKFEIEALSSLMARHVDGIIIASCSSNLTTINKIIGMGTPIVQIDRYASNSNKLPYVTTNNYQGSIMAVEYLIQNGHKKIACIKGPSTLLPVQDRTRGYLDTLKKYGLQNESIICGESFSVQNGYLETKLLLSESEPPTAILAQSNLILLGVIKAIFESDMKIPDDISVITFDNNIMYNYLNPALTCIAQPIEEIGILAVKILIKNMNSDKYESSHIHLPPSLIIRNSVKNIL